MKALVTGGAGFIGSNLAERLLADGHEVAIVDDLSTGHRRNLPAGASFHEGSILDAALLDAACLGAEVVFHQAALASVPRSIEDPVGTSQVNVLGTLQVLQAARRAGARKVVFAASSAAYGDEPTLPKVETMAPEPMSPYAVAKMAGEQYLRVFQSLYGLGTTSLRYFNVYGPRQDPNGAYAAVIPRFILAGLRGDPLTVHGNGLQSRDFVFVGDVVEANLLAARSTKADGHVINVGAGAGTDLNALARHVVQLTGGRSKVVHAPPRAGDVKDSLASLGRASELLGYAPKVAVAEGLRRTVDWFRQASRPS
jgi:UDP-glucose 4-epimerase